MSFFPYVTTLVGKITIYLVSNQCADGHSWLCPVLFSPHSMNYKVLRILSPKCFIRSFRFLFSIPRALLIIATMC